MRRFGGRLPLLTAVALAVGWLGLWLYFSDAFSGLSSQYHLRVAVPDAQNLASGADVMVAGLPVGHVSSITPAADGATVNLDIDQRYAPIPTDTRFAIRLRTLVGENYVQLYPGQAKSELPNGAGLPMSHADEYVNVDQILDTLRGSARGRARTLIRGVGAGIGGRADQLNQLVGRASTFLRDVRPVLSNLATRHQQVARLTDELGSVMAAIGQRGDAVRQLALMGRQTAQAIAARDAALRQTLVDLPSTLTQVRQTTDVVGRVTGLASPVVLDLAGVIRELKPTVSLLKPAASEGQRVLSALGTTAPPLQSTLTKLQNLASPTLQTMPAVHRTLCQLNPLVRYLAPYNREVPGVLQGMGSAGNFYDNNAHAFRLGVAIGQNSLSGFFPSSVQPLLQGALSSGLLTQYDHLGYDPTPPPGASGETYTPGMPVNAATVKAKFPHVLADC